MAFNWMTAQVFIGTAGLFYMSSNITIFVYNIGYLFLAYLIYVFGLSLLGKTTSYNLPNLSNIDDDNNYIKIDNKSHADNNDIFDVIIIGSGFSGLFTAKYCLQYGLNKILIIEKRDNLGGLWYFTPHKNIVSVSTNTECSSSKQVTEISDFQMNNNINAFPSHKQILNYLKQYAQQFKLYKYIKYNINVNETIFNKNTKIWNIKCNDNLLFNCKYLAICTGLSSKLRPIPSFYNEISSSYNIKIVLYNHIKTCSDLESYLFNKKNIIIIGGGESASYIIDETVKYKKKYGANISIYWYIRNGQYFMRKSGKYFNKILDEATSKCLMDISPMSHSTYSKPGTRWACKLFTNGSIFSFDGHGIYKWKSSYKFWRGSLNKEGSVLDYINNIHNGNVIPINNIKSTSLLNKCDIIILCNGYTYNINDFLPTEYDLPQNCFKYTLSISCNPGPYLGYIGFIRPVAGSIPMLSELSAIFIAKLWSNNLYSFHHKLSIKKLKIIQNYDNKYWRKYFIKNKSYNKCNIRTLVDPFVFIPIFSKIVYYPYGFDFYQIYKIFGISKWIKSYISPANSCYFQMAESIELYYKNKINESNNKMNKAINQIWRINEWGTLYWLIIVLFCRFFQVDVWIDFIIDVKIWIKQIFVKNNKND